MFYAEVFVSEKKRKNVLSKNNLNGSLHCIAYYSGNAFLYSTLG